VVNFNLYRRFANDNSVVTLSEFVIFIDVLQMLIMEKEIIRALATLQQGGLLLYPTDTVWGIGCDATNAEAVKAIYALKRRAESKALICLVADEAMLKQHVKAVPENALTIVNNSDRPTTVIYNQPRGVAENLVATDNTLAIRICLAEFSQALIRRLGKPIVSTSANISGAPTPKSFDQISDEIVKGVDYVVNLQRKMINSRPSRILQISPDDQINIIRE